MIDVVIISNGQYRLSPGRIHREIASNFQEPVRSVIVIDQSTGLTATFRDDEAIDG